MTQRKSALLLVTTLVGGLVVVIISSFINSKELEESKNGPTNGVLDLPLATRSLQNPQNAISAQTTDNRNEVLSPDRLDSDQPIKCSHEDCSEAETLYVNEHYLEAEKLLVKNISNATAGASEFQLSEWELYRSILKTQGRLVAYTAALQAIPEYLPFKRTLIVEHLSYLDQNLTEAEAQAFALAALSANPTNELLMETYAEILTAKNKAQESNALLEYLRKLNPENEFALKSLERR